MPHSNPLEGRRPADTAGSTAARLDALIAISQRLAQALSLEESLSWVLDRLLRTLPCAARGSFLVSRTTDQLEAIAIVPAESPGESTTNPPDNADLVRHVLRSGEVGRSTIRDGQPEHAACSRSSAILVVPVVAFDEAPHGVIYLENRHGAPPLGDDDIAFVQGVAFQLGVRFDNERLKLEVGSSLELRRELALSREVQRGFLVEPPPTLEGYELFCFDNPATQLGDYHAFIKIPGGKLAVVLADIIGHGLNAALLLGELAAETRNLLVSESDIGLAFAELNRRIHGSDRFVTMIAAVLDPETHQLTVVNAGHFATGRRVRADGSLFDPLDKHSDFPLGLVEESDYSPRTMTLEAGESLILFTDGITEALDSRDEPYGQEGFLEQLARAVGSAKQQGETLVGDIRTHVGSETQRDDMCLIVVRRSAM